MILKGYRCKCSESHYQNARYYVSVMDGTRVVLARGPYWEHDEALDAVDQVQREVIDKWNPDGRAYFYAFGTTAMISSHDALGKLDGGKSAYYRQEGKR
jgi:peptidoglycan/xylan/chitin deacetylase (PgdA/CDA1 family)